MKPLRNRPFFFCFAFTCTYDITLIFVQFGFRSHGRSLHEMRPGVSQVQGGGVQSEEGLLHVKVGLAMVSQRLLFGSIKML